MRQRIFPYDFIPYYPVGILPCHMYVDIANRIYYRIKDWELNLPNSDELKKEIAINVAIYYEDKMSNIGLWNAFVTRHQIMYHRPLPFFDVTDGLVTDDVNIQEVKLLTWLVLSRNINHGFLNPLIIGENVANLIMEVLTEDDDVEVNDGLYEYIYNTDIANDYFKLKHVLIWLRRSYLLCSPLAEERIDELNYHFFSILPNKDQGSYYAETIFTMTTEIGPLALKPHLYLADMYYRNHMMKEAGKLTNLSYCLQDVFHVTDANSEYAIVKDSKDETYKVKNDHPDMFYTGAYVGTSLVKYGNKDWEINGILYSTEQEEYEMIQKEKKQLAVPYANDYPLFMKRTNGKRLAFFKNTKQLKEWLAATMPEIDDDICKQLPNGSQVAFISPKAGILFAPSIVHAIKCKDNPYYKKCDAQTMQKETIDAVANITTMHPELRLYLLENEMLQDGDISNIAPCDLGNIIFTENIDFIARHYCRHYYHDHDIEG